MTKFTKYCKAYFSDIPKAKTETFRHLDDSITDGNYILQLKGKLFYNERKLYDLPLGEQHW